MGCSGWREVTLEEISEMQYGKMPKKELIVDKGFPIFSGYRITGYYKEFMFKEPQLIVVARGVGGTGDVKLSPPECYLTNLSIAVKLDESIVIKKYLYYYFRKMNLRYLDTGSAQSQITIADLKRQKVLLPDLIEQKTIADTLSCLDDKIELNNRINKKLEEIAQAIFKSWFVDFEPFQDGEFEDSELGMIPKGWRTGSLSDLVVVRYGKDHKKLDDGNIPVFGSGGVMRYVNKPLYSSESVLIPRKGTLNNVIYVNEPFWSVDTMFYTEMKFKYIAKFIYFFMESKDLLSMNAGSAVPSMTTDILNNMQVVIPPEAGLRKFEEVVSSMFIKIKKNYKENSILTTIRDTLLPKLMSGEIRVPLEEVANEC